MESTAITTPCEVAPPVPAPAPVSVLATFDVTLATVLTLVPVLAANCTTEVAAAPLVTSVFVTSPVLTRLLTAPLMEFAVFCETVSVLLVNPLLVKLVLV